MAPRMGPGFEKGRWRAIAWPVAVLVVAAVLYFLIVREPADSTPSADPLAPADQSDIANPETSGDQAQ